MSVSWVFLGVWGVGILFAMQKKEIVSIQSRLERVGHHGKTIFSGLPVYRNYRRFHMEREIAGDLAFLRNLLLLGSGSMLSLEYVLTRLSLKEGPLKPAYLAMLSYLRLNRKQEALEAFSWLSEVPVGREMGGLLLQWDELDGRVLSEILTSHQKTLREIRMTEQVRRDEMISDLVYLPAVLNVLLICVNFIYISYYINQQEIFQRLF
jgi:hypothetical protein